MKNTDIKSKSPAAETSNRERSKLDKRRVKWFKSPNISKMYAIRINHRTTFHFHTKLKRDNKIKQLKAEGIEYEIL